ncbi:magnesium-protoporphyrin IX monomethyl ester anaerobic oxidative cyclase [Luteitalea pratensis]|uniref:Magnesium-protoporphyrin IX monomethyl ester anaerobic oxidative cyclase n=1 Tax=Luteitalea pratensis TaxID=1855912 RepID=A0A143PHM0_LUTPR|nr:radical SAM protein [Luteitalea pratensis]AMY07578.1 magnesium-protoporphyrin IX monomethyl ester anaerobic oxidative cyclase [Luteitalea pratensis]
MNVLLLSMPDAFEHTPTIGMCMPNGALASLAGNIDPHHSVAIADLVLVQGNVLATVERLVREHRPDVIGLSCMTFQRRTALRLIRRLRAWCPGAPLVAGGYDPSLATDAWTGADGVDFVVRGEGEATFRELLRALEACESIGGADGRAGLVDGRAGSPSPARCDALASIAGLTWRAADGSVVHNDARPASHRLDETLAIPRRSARVLQGYTFLGDQVDVVETSRGCTFDCSFCSIIEMRGRNFYTREMARVIADITDARDHGAKVIFLVDDNVTLDVRRFEALCEAIIEADLHHLRYLVQGMTSAFAAHGERLAPLMKRAGFEYVFLGIENVLEDDLAFLRASAKNAQREGGRRVGNATLAAIDILHRHGIFVVGGLIVGNPDDTHDAIEANLAFARAHVDWPYIQHPTPYPRTPMNEDFRRRDLVVNERLEEYDGTTAVVRTTHLGADDIEFLRWKSERWMKVRHMPAVLRRRPGFVLRNAPMLLAHTFRGSTWRSMIGLESSRDTFRRYKAIRQREREYVAE